MQFKNLQILIYISKIFNLSNVIIIYKNIFIRHICKNISYYYDFKYYIHIILLFNYIFL